MHWQVENNGTHTRTGTELKCIPPIGEEIGSSALLTPSQVTHTHTQNTHTYNQVFHISASERLRNTFTMHSEGPRQ